MRPFCSKQQQFYHWNWGQTLSKDNGNFTYSKALFLDIKASSQAQLSEPAYRSYLSLIWTFLSPPQSDFDVEADKWMLAVESDISVIPATVLMSSNTLISFKPESMLSLSRTKWQFELSFRLLSLQSRGRLFMRFVHTFSQYRYLLLLCSLYVWIFFINV